MSGKNYSGRIPVTFEIERIHWRQSSQVILKSNDGRVYKFLVTLEEGNLCILYRDQIIEEKSLDPFEKEPARGFEVLDFFVKSYQIQSGNNFTQVNICRDDLGHLCAMLIDDKGNKFKMTPGTGLLIAAQNKNEPQNIIELVVSKELFEEKEGTSYSSKKPFDLSLE